MTVVKPHPTLQAVACVAFALLGETAVTQAGPWRAEEGNTRGWQLMTPQERIEHQARVRGFADYTSCDTYRTRHHAVMVERARRRGLALPGSHWDFCDRLQPRTSPPAAE